MFTEKEIGTIIVGGSVALAIIYQVVFHLAKLIIL